MSHKNDLSACIKWRAGNANGGRLEEESPQLGPAWLCLPRAENCQTAHLGGKAVARGRQGCFLGRLPCSIGWLAEVGAIEAVVLSLCQIQLGLIGVRES